MAGVADTFRAAAAPDERTRRVANTQQRLGRSPELFADFCDRKTNWVRRVVRKYSAEGPDAGPDRRAGNAVAPGLDTEVLGAPHTRQSAVPGVRGRTADSTSSAALRVRYREYIIEPPMSSATTAREAPMGTL